MKNNMKYLVAFSKYFVGILFLFSGFVKIIDPIGTAIKLEKYFHIFEKEFGTIFSIFTPYSLLIAILIISFEMILGFALLLQYKMKTTSWLLTGLIVFFTILTFYTHITGDPKDCGCFGDFIKLKPFESFLKDVVLLFFVLVILIKNKSLHETIPSPKNHLVMGILTFITFGFAIYNVVFGAFIDFRPYAIGKDVMAQISDGKPAISHYIIQKPGEEEQILPLEKVDNADWGFYKGLKEVEEAIPPTAEFFPYDLDGNEMQESILTGKSFVFLIRDNPNNEVLIQLISDFEKAGMAQSYKSFIVSSINQENFKSIAKNVSFKGKFTLLDQDMSKAVSRGMIAVLLFENGIVKQKWHYRSLPNLQEFSTKL